LDKGILFKTQEVLRKELYMEMLDRYFRLKEMSSSLKTEFSAGTTIFLTMAYIIFVQPAVLSIAGMPYEGVFLATCISSALACILMGLVSRYPIALAPGMGENFFFVFSVALANIGGSQVGWKAALAVVFISGILFLLLTLFRVRNMILEAVPPGLRYSFGVGIGLFIAYIGMMHAGIVVVDPVSRMPHIGAFDSTPTALAAIGLIFTAALTARRIRGAILWGILFTAFVGFLMGVVELKGFVSLPPNDFSTFLAFDFARIFTHFDFITLILIFLFMDIFDTLGTMVGVVHHAGLADANGNIPRANSIFFADAAATVFGSMMGTSTVTSYIESAAGVEAGGRTGLTAIVTGLWFFAALFFAPLVATVGAGWLIPGSDPASFLYPVTAPALIMVGSMMMRGVERINWNDIGEALPAFLTIIGIPLTYSINDGLALGFISYPLVRLMEGRGREVSPLLYIVALLFIARYIFL